MSQTTFKQDFMASIVVFLVALPLCMGIAIASGVPVAAGLITGIVGGIVVGFIGGCPLQVSGPAAGLTVLVLDIVQRLGLESLGIIVLLAGSIQMLAGVLRCGPWFRAVSPAVIKGMLAGIGMLIFASQFHVMFDDKPKGSGISNLITIPQAVVKGLKLPQNRGQESRKFLKQLLQHVGELHCQQVNLQERIGKFFPHVHAPGSEYTAAHRKATQSFLLDCQNKQRKIVEQLQQIVKNLEASPELLLDQEQDQLRALVQAAVAQGEHALQTLARGDPEHLLTAQDQSVRTLQALLDQLKNHHLAALVGLLSMAIIFLWHFAPQKLRTLPGPLIAVLVATAVATIFCLPVLYVELPDQLWDSIHFPSWNVLLDAGLGTLLKTALLVALIASAETLLCATAVDQLQAGKRTNYDRELFAQGVGNILCGILGALPMTGVIVRSSANIHAGAKSRTSAILHGLWLLIFVASLGFLLRQIPTACLAAILVYTGLKLVNFQDIRRLAKYGKSEVVIYGVTVSTIVITDLLTGVLVGIGLAALKLLYTFSHLETKLAINETEHTAILSLYGAATFIRLPLIALELEKVPAEAELHVDFEHLDYIDHACLELLVNWAKQHENTGGKLIIDWESLHTRFRTTGRTNSISAAGQPPASSDSGQ